MFIFTVTATFVCYIFTLIYKNTSIYDPYWSVAPFVMALIHMIRYSLYTINSFILITLIFLYAFRLTRNWWLTYKGINPKYEDWRYKAYRNKPAWIFHIINFVGLIYIPTVVVYASLVPALYLMMVSHFNYFSLFGYALMVIGPLIELLADHQVHIFIKEEVNEGLTCNYGLWRYSRHPNYFGELTFWLGISLTCLINIPEMFYVTFGYLLMVFLFIFISIPLMEAHNKERRKDYLEYKSHTSMLLFLPPKE